MDLNNQYPVYIGSWINWSRGQIFGATVTLKRNDATILIAFAAFFVAWGKSPGDMIGSYLISLQSWNVFLENCLLGSPFRKFIETT
jgi:hypothetical protein